MAIPFKLLELTAGSNIQTYTCTACKRGSQLILWEGGKCRRCWKPKHIPKSSYAAPAKPTKIVVLPETRALQEECRRMMEELQLPIYKFARIICKGQCSKSSFDNWWWVNIGEKGQRNMNERVRIGLDRLKEEAAA